MKNGTPFVPGWYMNFLAAVVMQLPRPDQIDQEVAEDWIGNQACLKGNLAECLLPPTTNYIVHVDRTWQPDYPEWAKQVIYPELEKLGPTEYSPVSLGQLLLAEWKDGKWTDPWQIYIHLTKEKMVGSCLGIADLLDIQRKGFAFFHRYFGGKVVFGWKSTIRENVNDRLHVPCLYEVNNEVWLKWHGLDDRVNRGDCPIFYFRQQATNAPETSV